MDIVAARELLAWVLALIFGAAATGMTLMRKYSKLGVAQAEDRSTIATLSQNETRIVKLEADLAKAYEERNTAVSQVGGLSVRVELLTDMMKQSRMDQIRASDDTRLLLRAREEQIDRLQAEMRAMILENTLITREGVKRADLAYEAANNFNDKFKKSEARHERPKDPVTGAILARRKEDKAE